MTDQHESERIRLAVTHEERAAAVLALAIRLSVRGHEAASGPLVRSRAESCLATALARCKEDATQMYEMIDADRAALKVLEGEGS